MRQIPSADDVEGCLATRHIYTIATGEDDKVIKVCDRGQHRDQTKPNHHHKTGRFCKKNSRDVLSYQCNSVPWSNNDFRQARMVKSVAAAVILLMKVFMNQPPLSFSSTVNLNVDYWKLVEELGHFT